MLRQALDTDALRAHIGPGSEWAESNGKRIAERREELGHTKNELAVKLGVTVPTLHRVERGELIPRDYLRLALSHVLGLPLGELFPMPAADVVDTFASEPAA